MFEDISRVVFFSDMDGTLLSRDKTFSEKNAEAIVRLRQAGGMFTAATGRVIQATRHYFEPLGLYCPVILCNGGMVYDCAENEVKWSEYLPEEKARKMAEELLEKFPEVCAEICRPDGIYDVNINEFERQHWKIAGFTAKICESFDDVPHGDWCKILFAMPETSIKPFAEYAAGLSDAGSVTFVTSSTVYHEMLPKDCTKGKAMKKLLEIYGLDDCVTVAIGDYDNDIEMLQLADFSACPSNATEDVKKICDFVCRSDCDSGAVAEVIEYILGNSPGSE